MTNYENIIELQNITKKYGAHTVLRDVDFNLKKGEIHALVGENGAGKTTLMKVLYGLENFDGGQVIIKGIPYKNLNTSHVKKLGLSLVPQKLNILPDLSIAENIFSNNWHYKGKKTEFINWKKLNNEAKSLLEEINIDADPRMQMGSLSYVDQQMIVIARTIFTEQTDLLILDEPTASLVEKEINVLFSFLKNLKQNGVSIIYISHFLHEIFKICDKVTILRDGRVVSCEEVAKTTINDVIVSMVGEEVELYPKKNPQISDSILEVKNLHVPLKLHDINFVLKKGEVLGIAGLKGCGSTEMARSICGIDKIHAGQIVMNGQPINIDSCKSALSMGIGYLPNDRINWGIIGCRPVKENTTITILNKIVSFFGLINKKQEREIVNNQIVDLDIRATGQNQNVEFLSGGNQQKVVLAKLLGAGLKILFLDEPTFGIDVKARTHVYRILIEFVARGGSVCLISSDIHELINLCDRILIIANGEVSRTLAKSELKENILQEELFGQASKT